MKNICIDDFKTTVAADMNELHPGYLLYLAGLVLRGNTPEEIKLKMFLHQTGIRVVRQSKEDFYLNGSLLKLPNRSRVKIAESDLYYLCSTMDFLIGENGGISPTLFAQKFPVIKVKGKYIGPGDGLNNLKWEEFIMTQTYFGRFLQNKDEMDLNRLIATLYRPGSGAKTTDIGFKGDEREPFNGFIVDDRAKLISKKVPENLRMCILWFYAGCLEYIKRAYPNVFPEPQKPDENPDGAFADAEPWQDPFEGMMQLTDVLCNEDVVRVEEVRQSFTHDVMRRLMNAKEKQKRQQEELEKLKNK